MGSALVAGLLQANWCAPSELAVVESNAATRDELATRFPALAILEQVTKGDLDEKTGAVLCVKPDSAEAVARTLSGVGVSRLLSVVAGLSTQRLEATFKNSIPVVRSMPNTPVLVGEGVSAISGGEHCVGADLEWAESILGAVGTVVRVPERYQDTVGALSGAMPAYLYMIVESLIEAGVHQGLTRDLSTTLVVDTFAGAGQLLKQSGETPEQLRFNVTSPGGVTAAGLRMLEQRAVRAAFLEAVAAAAERSRQLGR
jgi:pyrroline-5-carboxylate reductase